MNGYLYEEGENSLITVYVSEPLIQVILEVYDKNKSRKHPLLVARGSAKCDPADAFNVQFGINLAKARATERLAAKTRRLLIRSLK